MEDYKTRLNNLESETKLLKKDFLKAKKFTAIFLKECEKAKIKMVSIGVKTKRIPRTESWPFGCKGSVFQYPEGVKDSRDWPAIWGVVSKLGIGGGCGNTDQHAVGNDNLIEGVFELKGKDWRWIE